MNDADKTLRRILVVDDNENIHKDFELILSNTPAASQLDALEVEIFGAVTQAAKPPHQYKLDFATQGEQGVAMVRAAISNGNQPFQLAFVDMRMPPGWDGLETISRIWRIDARIQVVLCTAYSDYSWEEINQRLGLTENLLILKKPFDLSEVAQMANTLTQKWILAREAETIQDQLEELVAHRTQELNATNLRLQQAIKEREQFENQLIRAQKMEAVGTLAAGVAHDLNNILSGVVSYPDVLMLNLPADSPLRRSLSIIQQSGKKAAAIVQDMLTLARCGVVTRNAVDLKTIIDECLQSPECQKLLSYHPHINLVKEIQSDPTIIIGSEVHLAKTLMNLLSNAAEAIPDAGAITITLKQTYLDRPVGKYTAVVEGKYALLSVADTGIGIAERDLQHIFEPFYTRKKMGRSGTGLGMAVVWGTVKDHHGYIQVQSRVNIGTIFDLYFPCAGDLGMTPSVEEPGELPLGKGERILVVDDMPEQRKIAAQMLAKLGYQADSVGSGEEAVSYLDSRPADLVILDMLMEPGIDGLETCRRIINRHKAQKVIIASGYAENDRIRRARQLGSGAFLRKPYSLYDMAVTVSAELADSLHHIDDKSD
jgi:signal transduction histidine kinase